jgi:hypothetical protein
MRISPAGDMRVHQCSAQPHRSNRITDQKKAPQTVRRQCRQDRWGGSLAIVECRIASTHRT